MQVYAPRPCLGWRVANEYKWLSYAEVHRHAGAFAAAASKLVSSGSVALLLGEVMWVVAAWLEYKLYS